MDFFNILYESDMDDVDIICVPSEISEQMEVVVQTFLDWLPSADESNKLYWSVHDCQKYNVCETEGFVKWLNENYCNNEKAYIVEQHVQFCSKYKKIEF